MANEVQWTYADQVTLEASGASAASDVFVQAGDTSLVSGNHSNFPYGDFVLMCSMAGTPTAGADAINLYRHELNIDGTDDAPAPSSSYQKVYVGTFKVYQSAAGYYPLEGVELTEDCEFYIQNNTDQSLNAGWTLKCTPKTYVPASA